MLQLKYAPESVGSCSSSCCQRQLVGRDKVLLRLGQQPGVGIAAIVALAKQRHPFVDGRSLLPGAAGAHEIGQTIGLEAVAVDRGGHRGDARRVLPEVHAAGEIARRRLHQNRVTLVVRRLQAQDDVVGVAVGEALPGGMGDDDAAVRGPRHRWRRMRCNGAGEGETAAVGVAWRASPSAGNSGGIGTAGLSPCCTAGNHWQISSG